MTQLQSATVEFTEAAFYAGQVDFLAAANASARIRGSCWRTATSRPA